MNKENLKNIWKQKAYAAHIHGWDFSHIYGRFEEGNNLPWDYEQEEAYRPIKFYDIGAFVWFAHIIEWEFPDFSVDKCFEQLLKMQEIVDQSGRIEGTTHRYLIIAKK